MKLVRTLECHTVNTKRFEQDYVTYLPISGPFSVVDSQVGLCQIQLFQESIFWLVDKIAGHISRQSDAG